MILCIDIGNTSVAVGAYSEGEILRMERFFPARDSLAQALQGFIAGEPLAGAAISSVVPARNDDWSAALLSGWGVQPLIIGSECRLGVQIDYPRPERIGADRLANAVAATALFGAPVVAADFGTALTFDVVSAAGAYIGGVIAPGLPLMCDYLAERTALLPSVAIRPVDSMVGRSTEEAMLIGAQTGYRGMVSAIIAGIARQIGDFSLCATGGYAEWVLHDWPGTCHIVPELTLIGVGRIYELNA
jgi:type III pantothenate kinase